MQFNAARPLLLNLTLPLHDCNRERNGVQLEIIIIYTSGTLVTLTVSIRFFGGLHVNPAPLH